MNIMNSVIIIFLMMGTGFFFAKKNILDEKVNTVFGKLLINLTLPSTVMVAFVERFTKKDLINSIYKLGVCYLVMFSLMILGLIFVKIFKIEEKRQSAVVNMTMFANTLFIGLPVNSTLFGEESIPYLFIFWFASFSTFWTLGIYNFVGNKQSFSIMEGLKKMITPPLIAFALSIIFIIFGIKLPEAIQITLTKFGAMTTPISMLFLGTVIYELDFKNIKFNRDVYLVLISRFLLAPVVTILIITIAGQVIDINSIARKVFIVTASLPIMTNLAIISKYYKKDHEFTALMVGVTTMLSIITIPIHAYVLELIY